ncbi:DUF2147 domain-containing protein [Acinetobacter bereziniae]|uniref:DUF2147 domain-containing protein n=1 Tax=Acinetobacter bereziniae TaxID=106648 RepID=UPI0005A7E777|nr:DUF2147 domain-containing protein [Acinetobacter bereziniae]MBJ9948477.1 DUF2147 domain-containing protein [Acinetobacter bereziniae]MCU4417361.1 DUF2147 domain-containing protein [Acinetobacter bereziniae]RSZ27482.1 DUF2147 domain-containing protein [Acinetobacter bereziniae]
MKKGFFCCMLFSIVSWTHAADITGTWRTVDDKTGYVRAYIQIEKQKDDTYAGKIIKDFPAPGEVPLTQCHNCPAPFTNKPIIGLTILQKMKVDPKDPNNYIAGEVLDPRGGKIYHGKARLNASGNRLTLRGYIGISMIGRSQTWIRME